MLLVSILAIFVLNMTFTPCPTEPRQGHSLHESNAALPVHKSCGHSLVVFLAAVDSCCLPESRLLKLIVSQHIWSLMQGTSKHQFD